MIVQIKSAPSSFSMSLTVNAYSYQGMNLDVSTKEIPGSRWVASFIFTNKHGRDAAVLSTEIDSLMGGINNFTIRVPHKNSGSVLGAPKTLGVTALGASEISTTGWDADSENVLMIGDFIQLVDQVFRVTEDVSSDALGNATVKVVPKVRRPISNDVNVEAQNPRFTMKSTSINGHDYTMTLGGNAGTLYAISIDAAEV